MLWFNGNDYILKWVVVFLFGMFGINVYVIVEEVLVEVFVFESLLGDVEVGLWLFMLLFMFSDVLC